ncbi:MAG: class I SAM-dependent methyltransferase [Cyanobacteria bacterium P01_H01_bin.15]
MTSNLVNLSDTRMSVVEFCEWAERDLLSMQLPKPPLWHVAQDGVAADRPDGLWLEFGTGSATTTRMLCEARKAGSVFTFDSFEGLPEDWNAFHKKGAFKYDRPTDLPDNAKIVEGYFAEVLPSFLIEIQGKVDLLHIDCDIYSSTRTVLDALSDRIVPGSVVVFDELFYYPGRENHEAKALHEWAIATGAKFEWIGIHGTQSSPEYYAQVDADPSLASAVYVSAESRIIRWDVPLSERVALRIV